VNDILSYDIKTTFRVNNFNPNFGTSERFSYVPSPQSKRTSNNLV
jgi:hypothetical protein